MYEGYTTNGSTRFASLEPGEPDHAGAGLTHSVWYRFTAYRVAPAVFDTCVTKGADTVLAVYRDDGGTLVPVGANDDSAGCGDGTQSLVRFTTTANATYYIAVATRTGSSFTLRTGLAPANDDRANATDLTPNLLRDDGHHGRRDRGGGRASPRGPAPAAARCGSSGRRPSPAR